MEPRELVIEKKYLFRIDEETYKVVKFYGTSPLEGLLFKTCSYIPKRYAIYNHELASKVIEYNEPINNKIDKVESLR